MKIFFGLIGIIAAVFILFSLYQLVIDMDCHILDVIFTTELRGQSEPTLISAEMVKFLGLSMIIQEGYAPPVGGLAYLARYIEQLRKNNRNNVLLIDGGNIFLGTPKGYFSQGKVMIDAMNATGYDAAGLGNSDFYFGFKNLDDLAQRAEFPFLVANIVQKSSRGIPGFVRPYAIKEDNGLRVGIIGLADPDMDKYIFAQDQEDLTFLSAGESLQRYIPRMKKEGAELIILLSRLGEEKDRRLAEAIAGIDVIFGFRSYYEQMVVEPDVEPRQGTLLCYLAEKGVAVDHLRLVIDKKTKRIKRYKNTWELIWVSKIDIGRKQIFPEGSILGYSRPHREVQAVIDGYAQAAQAPMSEVVGYCSAPLLRPQEAESELGDWVADVMRKNARTDIAFCSGLEADLQKGDITRKDIYNILPFGDQLFYSNTLLILKLSGEEIKDVLEHSFSWVRENSKYGIVQVSGMQVFYDPGQPPWKRVQEVTIGQEGLKPDKIYTVAANGFFLYGDRYYPVKFAQEKSDSGIPVFSLLVDEAKTHSPVSQDIEDRIGPLKGE